ncbi:nucleotidyl transferase AbiEii/AbiGii toxin family protein [Mitsuaria sp. GD03876]|uniref:nucleotidyl transferase AbiEii/AbiGii toxin family protein n=1 Tax=Mitsuaria sp. GD03876 TaxID=2975399 RepID=UPI00244B4E85|nr:nucleotidyl transferase AbiEii/AbiGii toxin family protein [Mitsuaria sp. GD03876]MDH0865941.1 nucleotidyl transferase AbiEii/AbiGii toxin family protein [Mitsuaria sp. GD03876]
MSRNVAASVRARLKHLISPTADFNLLTTRFGLERLLYRLSISRHNQSFLLKGALLFTLWYQDRRRPTRDADLMAFSPTDVDLLVALFKEVCVVPADDGVTFDPDSVRGVALNTSKAGVVRITLMGDLARARLPIQIDIGHGDAVTPGPMFVTFPPLLGDLPPPQLLAYPKPTAIAEKLHAIWSHGALNTRMKDYYDLDILLHDDEVDIRALHPAIRATFANRGTPPPDPTSAALPSGLTEAFARNPVKASMWLAFLKKNRLPLCPLSEVIERLVASLRRLAIL